MERRLGRGLGALLPDSGRGPESHELALDAIAPNPHQPRKTFSPAGLEELRRSIVNHGVLQPVVVRPQGAGFELVSGERRWRAARMAGLRTIPAVVRQQVSENEMLELAIVENVQREDLDPIERAKGYHLLMERLGLTQEQVAERVGLKRSSVTNHLRLLELPADIQQGVAQGSLSMGHAKALLSIQDRNRLSELAANVVRDQLSVRDVERMAREERDRGRDTDETDGPEKVVTPAQPPWVADLERRMQDHLATKVSLKNGDGYRGQIVIHYYDREELERLLLVLAPKQEL